MRMMLMKRVRKIDTLGWTTTTLVHPISYGFPLLTVLTPHIFHMQCIGAVLGAGILHGCTPTSVSATLGANGLGPNNVTGVGLVAVSPGAGYQI